MTKKKPKVQQAEPPVLRCPRDLGADGLTEEERKLQMKFPFPDSGEDVGVKPQPGTDKDRETHNGR